MSARQSQRGAGGFDRCNLAELNLQRGPQHGGRGEVLFQRIAARADLSGPCNYIDYAEIPPDATIGMHRHTDDEEEFFLILGGEGVMTHDDGNSFAVRTGELIRNPPGGAHGLVNSGSETLRLFVFQLSVPK